MTTVRRLVTEINILNKTDEILAELDRLYPPEKCFLNYEEPWQLLFSTILSAQCTDARVNLVTEELYGKYGLEWFASVGEEELEQAIRSTGFYHNKAKNIRETASVLLEKYDGEVPSDIEELTALPGVGRKTANVIRSYIYGIPSIVVDTHVKRVSRLLGLTDTDDPVRAEFELMKILPEDHWIRWNSQIIRHGRTVCVAGRPDCARCTLAKWCEGRRK